MSASAPTVGECLTLGGHDGSPCSRCGRNAPIKPGTARRIIARAVAELDAEHYPDPEIKGRGGCWFCWPKDGGWPCTSRMIADDLRRAL